jgi:hypothetical protein
MMPMRANIVGLAKRRHEYQHFHRRLPLRGLDGDQLPTLRQGEIGALNSADQDTITEAASRRLVPVKFRTIRPRLVCPQAVQSPRRRASEDQNGAKSDVKMLTRIQGVRTKRSIAYLIVSSRPIPNLPDTMPEDG